MRCLNENLDDVRALTTVLATTNRASLAGGIAAVGDLTPVARCADVRVLRSIVALPRDVKTLQAMQGLQSSLKEVRALYDVGSFTAAVGGAVALRPKFESLAYSPLLAELLELTGEIEIETGEPRRAEATLKQSLAMAVGAGDDLDAARAAAALIWMAGYVQGRFDESTFWWTMANSFLDHLGDGRSRVRAWTIHNRAAAFLRAGEPEEARKLLQQAVELKEELLGRQHPDVAKSLAFLGDVLKELGHFQEALEMQDRAAAIFAPNTETLYDALSNRGEALIDLKRFAEAEVSLQTALRGWEASGAMEAWATTFPLTALGFLRLATDDSSGAVPYFERALRIREATDRDATLVAETRFGLARALWQSGGDRARSLSLARAAHETYERNNRPRQLSAVDAWLAVHGASGQPSAGRRSRDLQAPRPGAP
jgi:tetratricopeptide (TPR) repeat protein